MLRQLRRLPAAAPRLPLLLAAFQDGRRLLARTPAALRPQLEVCPVLCEVIGYRIKRLA